MKHALQWIGLLSLLYLAAACAGGEGQETGNGSPNTLNWSAGTETGVYGYLIYRSENRDGPFRRINEEIVRVPGDGAEEHDYSYADHDVRPGKTYYYYLDVVAETGIKQRFSGVVSKTAGDNTAGEPG